jgi:hypothetical protein
MITYALRGTVIGGALAAGYIALRDLALHATGAKRLWLYALDNGAMVWRDASPGLSPQEAYCGLLACLALLALALWPSTR